MLSKLLARALQKVLPLASARSLPTTAMATGTPPDATSTITITSGVAAPTDAVLQDAFQDTGTLRVSADHFLVKAMPQHVLLRADGDYDIAAEINDWALMRTFDISALATHKARWSIRPAFASQICMDLQSAGGLNAGGYDTEGAVAHALEQSARSLPACKLQEADVIFMAEPRADTWLKALCTRSLMGADGSGKVYGQFRVAMGGAYKLTSVASETLTLIGEAVGGVIGSVDNLSTAQAASVIGKAFVTTATPTKLDFIPCKHSLTEEAYRRGSSGELYFTPLFERGWRYAYKSIAAVCDDSYTAAEAVDRALMAATELGLSASEGLTKTLADAVERRLSRAIHVLRPEDTGDKLDAVLDGMARTAGVGARGEHASTSAKLGETAGQSDDAWLTAQREPDFTSMLTELAPLHTKPLNASACATVMLKAKSPAGLMYLNSTQRPPKVKMLEDMTAARAASAVATVFNTAVKFDRLRKPQPSWGTPLSEAVCEKLRKGTWCAFDRLDEDGVVCGAGALNWWEDIARPVVTKEDGPEVAARLSPSSKDPLALFLDSSCLERTKTIVCNTMEVIGITGTEPFTFRSMLTNIKQRLERIEALPDSDAKSGLMAALRYATALGLEEGRQDFHLMLKSSVAVACRREAFFVEEGGAHNMFADIDTLIEEHTKEQRLARFRGKRPHEDSTPTEQVKRTQPSPGTGDPGPKRVWYGHAAEEQSVRVDDSGSVYFGQNQGSLLITRSGDSANCTPDCYARLLAAKPYTSQKGYESRAKWCTNHVECRRRWYEDGVDSHATLPDGVSASEVTISQLKSDATDAAKAARVVYPAPQATAPAKGGKGKGAGTGRGIGKQRGGSKGKGGGKGKGRGRPQHFGRQ